MHHANVTFHMTHANFCDHHQLYPIPITLLAQHHVLDLAYDLQTTLSYFPFLVLFSYPTSHKPWCCVVRALSPVSPHMNLVLIFCLLFVFKTSCIYPIKRRVFPPEFRLSLSCLIISPCSTLYLHPTL